MAQVKGGSNGCFDVESGMTGEGMVFTSTAHARQCIGGMYRHGIKPAIVRGGAVRVWFEVLDPTHRHQLRKLFNGPLLDQISRKALIYGVRWTKTAWKQFFKDELNQGDSTEGMGDEEMQLFCLQVCVFACMEMGVRFDEAAIEQDLQLTS